MKNGKDVKFQAARVGRSGNSLVSVDGCLLSGAAVGNVELLARGISPHSCADRSVDQ